MKIVDLSNYDNSWYKPGSKVKMLLWMIVSAILFRTTLPVPSLIKVKILRLFGANVGKGVMIKPSVTIKYPWFLSIGDFVWIGEDVWIDNLARVTIEDHCCVSQGAYLLTGNHDFNSPNFDLKLGEINLKEGSWIGAKSVVCPDVTLNKFSILAVGSIATKNMDEYGIYQGNPAQFKKNRQIN